MLTRVYGTAFAKKEELNEYLEYLANIKNRDHNKLGREMELFTTVDVIGQGSASAHAKRRDYFKRTPEMD